MLLKGVGSNLTEQKAQDNNANDAHYDHHLKIISHNISSLVATQLQNMKNKYFKFIRQHFGFYPFKKTGANIIY